MPLISINNDANGTTFNVDGVAVGRLLIPPAPTICRAPPVNWEFKNLTGPSLKVKRAKRCLDEFTELFQSFFQSQPIEITTRIDTKKSEIVYSVQGLGELPQELRTIAGDIIHNLRSALDQLVACLVRANRKQTTGKTAFPISGSLNSFQDSFPQKLRNISAAAERFIKNLKPYNGGNQAFWLLSELDNMDKHDQLIPIAVSDVKVTMQAGMREVFVAPDGGINLGGGPPGSLPLGYERGFMIPANAKPVKLVPGETCELFRENVGMNNFQRYTEFSIHVALGHVGLKRGEDATDILHHLISLVERVLHIVERRFM